MQLRFKIMKKIIEQSEQPYLEVYGTLDHVKLHSDYFKHHFVVYSKYEDNTWGISSYDSNVETLETHDLDQFRFRKPDNC